MSYESGWGFESGRDDSLCMSTREAAQDSHLLEHQRNPGTFIVQLEVSETLIELCSSGHICNFKIDGDYEQSSSIQIVRYLTGHMKDTCIVLPVISQPNFTVITKNRSNIELVVKMCATLKYNVSLSDNLVQDSNVLRQHVLASVLYHLMKLCGYRMFATENQVNGVLAKKSQMGHEGLSELDNLDVVALRNCVVNDRNEVYLTVDCHCYHMRPFTREMSDCDSATFIPTMETVSVVQLLSMNSSSSNRSSSQQYLTDYDRLCKSRGYNQYLPDRADSFALYWDLLYGCQWRQGNPVVHIRGAAGSEVGERIVPLEALCCGVQEVPSKTKQSASEIVHRFMTALSIVPHLSGVRLHNSPPTLIPVKQASGLKFASLLKDKTSAEKRSMEQISKNDYPQKQKKVKK